MHMNLSIFNVILINLFVGKYFLIFFSFTNSKTQAILTIFHKSAEFIPITRSELFSTTDLNASCGGILGLFMGFSIISFAEIIYYCTIRPLGRYLIKKRKMADESVENMLHLDNRNNVKFITTNNSIYSRAGNIYINS